MTEKQNPPAEGHAFQDEVTELEAKSATAARLFDIRRIIGALFVVYGLIVSAQVLRGAGLVVGAGGAAAAEGLLADDGAGRLV
ncbi:hypothetical protein, partial [Streptomyces diastaticus]|uniref:hypothetical protein n=1 Tax=Streptomyces diastaticus TaxID=1956 RepID=UPI0036475155